MSQYPSIQFQKDRWSNAMTAPTYSNDYSYGWGDPCSSEAKNLSGQVLGNYLKIKDKYLLPNIEGKTVVEIGSLDGKWVRFMDKASKVICVDLSDEGYKKMNYPNTEFYLTKGNELSGIPNDSVDFVLSMDSLVRSEFGVIADYIKEIYRVLSRGGSACLHLPFADCELSSRFGFTPLNSHDIMDIIHANNFKQVSADYTTINHGILLQLKK